jgi:hypothetical protein
MPRRFLALKSAPGARNCRYRSDERGDEGAGITDIARRLSAGEAVGRRRPPALGYAGRGQTMAARLPSQRQAKTLAIGVYPTTSLREARYARDDARRLLSSGQDPSLVRKLGKAAKAKASANTFNSLADELLEKKRVKGKAQRTFDKVEWLLDLASPDLRERPVTEIAAPEVLRVLKTVEALVSRRRASVMLYER